MTHNKLVLLAVILISTLISAFAFIEVARSMMIAWDEGGYLWQAYVLREAFLSQGLGGFWKVSLAEVYYPFLQSWYLLFSSSFLGFNIDSLRLANTLLIIPSALLMWFLSNELIQKRLTFKLIPVTLFLTSPMVIFFFPTVLKEGAGVTLTLLSCWLYFLSVRKKSSKYYFLTGISLLALFLTKYNYGVLVIATLALESLISKSIKGWLFGPLVLGLFWWIYIAHNNLLSTILTVLQNNFVYNLQDTSTLGHLIYYPAEIAYSYLLSPVLAFPVIIAFCWSLKRLNDTRVRVLTFFFLLNLILAAKHMGNNQARFIFTAVPVLFLLGGLGLNLCFEYLKLKLRKSLSLKVITATLLVLILVPTAQHFLNFWGRVRSVGSHQIGSPVFYEKDYDKDWRFDFDLSRWPHQLPPKEEIAGQTIDDVFSYVFSQIDLSGEVKLLTPINEFSPNLFNFKLAMKRDHNGIEKLNPDIKYSVILQLEPESRFDNIDYQRFTGKTAVEQINKNHNTNLVSQKRFPYLGIEVSIFDNN